MFKLHDIRKTKVWQEAYEEGRKDGIEEGRKEGLQKLREQGIEEGRMLERQRIVRLIHSKGYSLKEIAELLDLPLAEVRRLAKA